MPYQSFVSANVSQLAGLLRNASNNKSIYFYKNANGVIQAFESENQQNTNNTGYPYQFLNGEVSYSTLPITNISQIPYDFNYTGLGALYTSNLVLWYDAREPKNINTTAQRILSKGFSTNEIASENTVSQSFTYSNNTIDLSSGANLETINAIPQRQFWTLCMVLTLTNQTLTNHTIFQHNDISIRISGPRLAPDTVNNTYMISLHSNGTFRQGISFKPSDPNFRYIIYCNQAGNFQVNGNNASQTSLSFSSGSNHKVFIGQQSDGLNNAFVRLHELFYYTSTSDNIGLNYSAFTTYLNYKWNLTTYFDNFNNPPTAWTNTFSRGNRQSIITISGNWTSLSRSINNWIDGNVSGENWYYIFGPVGTFIQFDLQTPKTIDGIKFIGQYPSSLINNSQPVFFNFTGSNDGTNWITIASNVNRMASLVNLSAISQTLVPETDFVIQQLTDPNRDPNWISNCCFYLHLYEYNKLY